MSRIFDCRLCDLSFHGRNHFLNHLKNRHNIVAATSGSTKAELALDNGIVQPQKIAIGKKKKPKETEKRRGSSWLKCPVCEKEIGAVNIKAHEAKCSGKPPKKNAKRTYVQVLQADSPAQRNRKQKNRFSNQLICPRTQSVEKVMPRTPFRSVDELRKEVHRFHCSVCGAKNIAIREVEEAD